MVIVTEIGQAKPVKSAFWTENAVLPFFGSIFNEVAASLTLNFPCMKVDASIGKTYLFTAISSDSRRPQSQTQLPDQPPSHPAYRKSAHCPQRRFPGLNRTLLQGECPDFPDIPPQRGYPFSGSTHSAASPSDSVKSHPASVNVDCVCISAAVLPIPIGLVFNPMSRYPRNSPYPHSCRRSLISRTDRRLK